MSKWTYFCCEDDLYETSDEDVKDMEEWNKDADEEGLPKYQIFNTKEEALAQLLKEARQI